MSTDPRPLRLGAVSYLNARPMVQGLTPRGPGPSALGPGERPLLLRFDVPSVCARLLADGEIDLGLVPSITYPRRPGDRIVPGVAIGSDGPVASVAIFTRRPIREVRTLALDTSSRTSAALTRILCARRFEITPTFVEHGPDLGGMLAAADAALLIGDPALFADPHAFRAEKIDLGAEWTAMTGRPFVWAFWVGDAGAAAPADVRRLQRACAEGVAASDAIADAYCVGNPGRQAVAREYLREHMRYPFDTRAVEGLRLYYREAVALGLVPRDGPIGFFPEPGA